MQNNSTTNDTDKEIMPMIYTFCDIYRAAEQERKPVIMAAYLEAVNQIKQIDGGQISKPFEELGEALVKQYGHIKH